jgi:hypothetical protein
MRRRPSDGDLITRLGEIIVGGATSAHVPELRNMLGRRSSVLVARASRVVAEIRAEELAPDLVAAFNRLLDGPATADEGCLAKVALAEAMDAVRLDDKTPFLRGIRHTQMEWAFEGRITRVAPGEGMDAEWTSSEKGHRTQVDTAPTLRARCGFALARLGGPEATLAITDLLTDPEPEARVGAVRAVAHRGGLDAEVLLRLKADSRDDEPAITAECLTELMNLDARRSLEFVAAFLRSDDDELAQAAALALGRPGTSAAFEALRDHRSRPILSPAMEDATLLAIALTRRDEAVDYLLSVIADDTPRTAGRAVAAMRIYADGAHGTRKVRDAVRARDVGPAWDAFREHFLSDDDRS